jgi:hypothetical protein
MNEELLTIAFVGIGICMVLFFLGTAFKSYVDSPVYCSPTVIKLGENTPGTHTFNCKKGSIALPPEKIIINKEEIGVVRCICDEVSTLPE